VSNTQGKKTSGGSFQTITTDPAGRISVASDPTVTAVPVQVVPNVSSALNQWHNCAGAGTAAQLAQKVANAAGVTIQEV